jgi:hypothetical protein
MPEQDEFYTGYLPQAPPGVAAWTKKAVVLVFVVTAAVALALAAAQSPFSKAVYHFGDLGTVEGVVRERPYPTLEVDRPGAGGASRYLLVNPFKHGATVDGLDGKRVAVVGSLIHRDDQTMLEIVLPGKTAVLGAAGDGAAERSLGVHTLVGRIVDSKCWLGIMKPGEGKPHRSCAARCISGGIPPLFVVGDERGPLLKLLLVDAGGGAVNRRVLHLVDEPLEIRGEVARLDDLWILKADPETYRRLAP